MGLGAGGEREQGLREEAKGSCRHGERYAPWVATESPGFAQGKQLPSL
jgi:hypothetical protein